MRRSGEPCRSGAIAVTLVLTVLVGGCALTPGQRAGFDVYGHCVLGGAVAGGPIAPITGAIAVVVCAPVSVAVGIGVGEIKSREPERQRRKNYLARFEWIGDLPETEISPAGELYMDRYSPKLNDRERVDAKLVVGLDKKSSLKEWSIKFDAEADCTAGTLHVRNARSYTDVGGWGDLVAYNKWTPTDPIEGMHPVLGTALERVCQSAGLEIATAKERAEPSTAASTTAAVANAGGDAEAMAALERQAAGDAGDAEGDGGTRQAAAGDAEAMAALERQADALRDSGPAPTASVPGPATAGGTSPGRPSPESSSASVAALRDSGPAPTLPANSRLPAVGTTWTYRVVDRMYGRSPMEIQIRVQNLQLDSASVTELVTTAVGASRRDVFSESAQVLQVPLGGNASVLELAPYLLARGDEGASLSTPNFIGYPHGPSGLAPWRIRVRKRGWVQVRVPAGSYRALRIQIDGKREREDYMWGQNGEFSIIAWYAPEVKRLVRLEHKTWELYSRTLNEHTVLELAAFRPAF